MPNLNHQKTYVFVGVLSVLLIFLSLFSAQRKISQGHDVYTIATQEIEWISSALLLDHFRLYRTLEDFQSGDSSVSEQQVQSKLNIYWSRYTALVGYYNNFIQSTQQFSGDHSQIASSLDQLKQVKNYLELTSRSVLASVETHLMNSLRESSGIPAALGELQKLENEVYKFTIISFEVSRYFGSKQSTILENLLRRLSQVYLAALLGLIIAGLALYRYLIEKRRLAEQLLSINVQLEKECGESARMASELKILATQDSLTGAANRRSFEDELARVLSDRQSPIGLCFIDLDLFKVVNDTAGHAAGDRLLVRVTDALTKLIPPNGAIARFGGDEFVILIPDIAVDRFKLKALEICSSICSIDFSVNEESFSVSCSVGAVHSNTADQTSDRLLAAADLACYDAKKAGGGQVVFSDSTESMMTSKRVELDWVRKIKHALQHQGFCLYFQPIVDLHEPDVAHHARWEVLIRLQEADKSIVSPGVFLPIAERYQLATKIDRYVIEAVFKRLQLDKVEQPFNPMLNINLSGQTVGNSAMLAFIESKMSEYKIDSSRICFEITETAAIGPDSKAFLARLKTLGFQLALDDFGSGFSSFGYLESLPVDYVKIDGQFVRDLDTNNTHLEFVKAIHSVSTAMGKQTVVEFVENEATLHLVRSMGIQYAQGYYFAKPEPKPILLPSGDQINSLLRIARAS